MRLATCCAPDWRKPPGSRWMTPGPATRQRTAPARRSATTTAPGWVGTTASKSRLNFLELLRAGHPDYVIDAEALAYMRERGLSGPERGDAPPSCPDSGAQWS